MSSDSPITVEPLVVRPEVAAAMLGVGRTRLFEMIKTGEVDSRLDGKRRLIKVESLHQYVACKFAGTDEQPARHTEKATAASLASRKAKRRKRRAA